MTDCTYQFDPAETASHITGTWTCPHDAHPESERCIFHMDDAERHACGVTDDDVVETLRENLDSRDPRSNEYVGADLPALTFTYQRVRGVTNHPLDFRHADIASLDLTHGRLDQSIDLRGATVGHLALDEARLDGSVEASDVTVTGPVDATEAVFGDDTRFADAHFEARVTCDETAFGEDTTFANATFAAPTTFRNATARGTSHELDDHVSFAGTHFEADVNFDRATVECATYANARFDADAYFGHVTFHDDTVFADATFHGPASFDEARFEADVTFSDATFGGVASFRGAEFRGGARTLEDDAAFDGATFRDDADFTQARFREANFADAIFEGSVHLVRAGFGARVDMSGLHAAGPFELDDARFDDGFDATDARFDGETSAIETQFYGDADVADTVFGGPATFDEVRFHEDVSFERASFRDVVSFRGALFEGEAKSLDDNATFEGAAFEADARFADSTFTNLSLWDVTFGGQADFSDVDVTGDLHIRARATTDDVYVDFSDATVHGGHIVEPADSTLPYDLTEATVGDITLERNGDGDGDLLDAFRFCKTEFDRFDFSDHHTYLERNDWTIHEFVGDDTTADVEMTPAVIEETYRSAMASAADVGDTPAKREFEFKRYHYNRQKNFDLLRSQSALGSVARMKKASTVALNYMMQITCGYGNRLPRIAALTFLLPAFFGVLYVLGGPLETGAGVVWTSPSPLHTLGDGLYYSYISFSTIGYGGIGPIGSLAKLLAASQGMLNGLLFTLLTFTLFKRVLGGS
ncbi:pentapeptide repeat-containing protein [Halarchaeum sp. P4]|uniref:pentapeptide repeat-containing protein n=1 Tax=Halarchaeum sp. P4 TaxID=3421639 RepID=UPI003EB8BB4B